jgi:hypothetical protein
MEEGENLNKEWEMWTVHHSREEDQWSLYLLTIICAKTRTMMFDDLLLEMA